MAVNARSSDGADIALTVSGCSEAAESKKQEESAPLGGYGGISLYYSYLVFDQLLYFPRHRVRSAAGSTPQEVRSDCARGAVCDRTRCGVKVWASD